jgi:hypothetical protein
MEDLEQVILKALSCMFACELVEGNSISERRAINNDNNQLSITTTGSTIDIGEYSYYEHTTGWFRVSSTMDTAYLCEKYLGQTCIQLEKYSIAILWDEKGFMLDINDGSHSSIFNLDDDIYLKRKGIDINAFMKKLNDKFSELS